MRLWARGNFAQAEHEESRKQLDEAFAAFNLVPDRPALPPLEIYHLWPENVEPWRLFMEVQTEWRGSSQREGLDKAGVDRVMRAMRVRPARRRQRFDEIRIMERAALDEWRKRDAEQAAAGR